MSPCILLLRDNLLFDIFELHPLKFIYIYIFFLVCLFFQLKNSCTPWEKRSVKVCVVCVLMDASARLVIIGVY